MTLVAKANTNERYDLAAVRAVADQEFSRAAGAPLVGNNSVRLLRDAAENYPAWLEAISSARLYVHFESYIIHDDDAGRQFAAALIAKAQQGVRVRLVYDWLGGLGKASRKFWRELRAGGVEVRCYNPPRLDAPLGWLSRDHRKTLTVDGEVGYISGLCVGRMWIGAPNKGIEAWRDTGVEIRGPAVSDIERAFARLWGTMGEPLRASDLMNASTARGSVSLRIIASEPGTAGIFRLDQLVSAIARERVWLTDAYYAGTAPFVQALRAAALNGVDVRLLVPNSTDIPILRPISRAGYRPLLEAGVRVFEWNGTMIHAKTAVADGRWARVGSTNLNIASWIGNYEMDAMVEEAELAEQMEQQYLRDLQNATEVVLDTRQKVHAPGEPAHPFLLATSGGGSAGRAAAGALRIANAVGAAFTDRRVLHPIEGKVVFGTGALLLGVAVLFYFFPRVAAYPLLAVVGWFGVALLYRGYKIRSDRAEARKREQGVDPWPK